MLRKTDRWLLFVFVILFLLPGCCPGNQGQERESDQAQTMGGDTKLVSVFQYEQVSETETLLDCRDFAEYGGSIFFLAEKDAQMVACRLENGEDLTCLPLSLPSEDAVVSSIAFYEDRICYASSEEQWDESTGKLSSYEVWITMITTEGESCFSVYANELLNAEQNYPMVTGIGFSEDGILYLSTVNALYQFNADGELLRTKEIIGHQFALLMSAQRDLYLYDWEQLKLYGFDSGSFTVGEAVYDAEKFNSLYPGGSEDFYALADDGLYSVDIEENRCTQLLSSNDVPGLRYAFSLPHDRWLIARENMISDETTLYLAELRPEPENKTLLTLAVKEEAAMDQYIRRVVSQFNFENPDCEIQVAEYSDELLRTTLLSGDAPDLLLFESATGWESLSPQACQRIGALADLYEWIDRDEEYSRSSFLGNVLQAAEYEGALCTIPCGFQFRTVYSSALLGGREGWSLSAFLDAAETLPEYAAVCDDQKSSFLHFALQWCLGDFVEEDGSTCSFDSPLFLRLLTDCNELLPSEEEMAFRVPPDEYLLNYLFSIFGLDDLCAGLDTLDSSHVVTGFPDADGGQFSFYSRLGISAQSPNQEAAWRFIRMALAYGGAGGTLAPVLEDRFLAAVGEMRERYSDRTVDRMVELIYAAHATTDLYSPVPDIVVEEAQAYFAGDKSAEETAAAIQSRVSLFLSEQG